jgi:DNA-binding transcriptional LysR family regulator
VDPSVLNGQDLVMITSAQFMQRQLEELTTQFHLSIGTAAVVKSLEAQIGMVKAGVGMALTTTGIERFVSGGEVRFYSFAHPLPRRQVVVAWRTDRTLSRAAEELKKIICETPL